MLAGTEGHSHTPRLIESAKLEMMRANKRAKQSGTLPLVNANQNGKLRPCHETLFDAN